MCLDLRAKNPLFLADLKLEFFRQIVEKCSYIKPHAKIRQVGTQFFLADGQTVGRHKADSRHRNFVKAIITHRYTVWAEGRISEMLHPVGRVQLNCDGTRWRMGGEVKGNWWVGWVAHTLHTTSEHGASSITTADAHTSAASRRLNWRPPPI